MLRKWGPRVLWCYLFYVIGYQIGRLEAKILAERAKAQNQAAIEQALQDIKDMRAKVNQ